MKECSWQEVKSKVQSINLQEQKLKAANIVLFGAGRSGEVSYRRLANTYHIVAFSDNNPDYYRGGGIYGIEIIEPCRLPQIDNVMVIITVNDKQYCTAIRKQLNELNVKCITYVEYIIAKHWAEFEMVYERLLEDESSKSTYRNILMGHLELDPDYFKAAYTGEQQYFALPEFNLQSRKDVFVDCGAYVGDTMETFIYNKKGTFKKMYLFEPAEKTCCALNCRKERLLKEWALEEEKIVVEKKAVGARNEMVTFLEETNRVSVNQVREGTSDINKTVQAVALDYYFGDINDKPSFIKADIEGAEEDLIHGAESIISKYRPLIAICVYHNIEDLYEIPIKLKHINPTYKMAIRHHRPSACETVLYCY